MNLSPAMANYVNSLVDLADDGTMTAYQRNQLQDQLAQELDGMLLEAAVEDIPRRQLGKYGQLLKSNPSYGQIRQFINLHVPSQEAIYREVMINFRATCINRYRHVRARQAAPQPACSASRLASRPANRPNRQPSPENQVIDPEIYAFLGFLVDTRHPSVSHSTREGKIPVLLKEFEDFLFDSFVDALPDRALNVFDRLLDSDPEPEQVMVFFREISRTLLRLQLR